MKSKITNKKEMIMLLFILCHFLAASRREKQETRETGGELLKSDLILSVRHA